MRPSAAPASRLTSAPRPPSAPSLRTGEYLGHAIAPGIEISLDALVAAGGSLDECRLVDPGTVIGKNTTQAMQAGAIYGFAGQVDGIVGRMREELGGRR